MGSTRKRCSRPRLPKEWPISPVPLSPLVVISPTPCDSASPPPIPTASMRASPDSAAQSTRWQPMSDGIQGLDDHERKVLDLIDVDEIVALTQTLVAAPGENPPGGEGPTAEVLAEACRARGLEVTLDEVEPGRPNVRAVLPGGDAPGLLLLGHTDVVPAGNGWTVDPLGGLLTDGRIYGRGSSDMLGGLAACVVALDALRRSGIGLTGGIELSAVVDEEETGNGIRYEIASQTAPNYAGCIVAEPTSLQTIVAARGDAYLEIEVARR